MSTSISQHFSPWSLLKFTFSSIIMMMFMSLYTIVDGIFISRFIGSNALSSLNIVYPGASIVIAIGTMLATGGNAAGIWARRKYSWQKNVSPFLL